MIKEALDQVNNVTGDLYGVLFHFILAGYYIFYPSLIQPVQHLLGWKRICGSYVTKCYQQSADLTTMIADELTRWVLIAYFDHACHDAELFQQFESVTGSK